MLFADFINYAMETADITKYKLAKRLGVSQSTVANWISGYSEPRDKRRAEVLELFGVDEYDLEQGFPEISYKEAQKEPPQSEAGTVTGLRKEAIDLVMSLPESELDRLVRILRAYAEE